MKVKGILLASSSRAPASDGDIDPYHGWLISYKPPNLEAGRCTLHPEWRLRGIWREEGPPTSCPNGNLLLGTGNGTFDAFTTTTAPGGTPGRRRLQPRFQRALPERDHPLRHLHTGNRRPGLDRPVLQRRHHHRPPAAADVYQPLDGTGVFTAGAENPGGHLPGDLVQRHHALETITDLTTGSFSRDYQNVNLPPLSAAATPLSSASAAAPTADVDHCDHELDLLQRQRTIDARPASPATAT